MEQLIERGVNLVSEGKIQAGEGFFWAALIRDPENVDALNNLGVVLYKQGRKRKAEQFLARAVDIAPYYLPSLLNLVDLYESEQRWEERASYLERVSAISGTDTASAGRQVDSNKVKNDSHMVTRAEKDLSEYRELGQRGTDTATKEQCEEAGGDSDKVPHKMPETFGNGAPKKCCEDPDLIRIKRELTKLCRKIVKKHGPLVQSGPFSGMIYPDSSFQHDGPVSRLVGSYEKELHNAIRNIIRRQYRVIVNIGCGEGYYAVGLAMRIPDAVVYAFDIDPACRKICEAMARINGVGHRVIIQESCDGGQMKRILGQNTLVFCDCEGYEFEILDPQHTEELKKCDFLVEMHDCINPSISDVLISRFKNSHWIQVFNIMPREPSQYECLQLLEKHERRLALCEFRPNTISWAFMLSMSTSNYDANMPGTTS